MSSKLEYVPSTSNDKGIKSIKRKIDTQSFQMDMMFMLNFFFTAPLQMSGLKGLEMRVNSVQEEVGNGFASLKASQSGFVEALEMAEQVKKSI